MAVASPAGPYPTRNPQLSSPCQFSVEDVKLWRPLRQTVFRPKDLVSLLPSTIPWAALLRLSEKGFRTIGLFVHLSRLRTQKIIPRHHGDLRRQKGSVKNLLNALVWWDLFRPVQFNSSRMVCRAFFAVSGDDVRRHVASDPRFFQGLERKKKPEAPLGVSVFQLLLS